MVGEAEKQAAITMPSEKPFQGEAQSSVLEASKHGMESRMVQKYCHEMLSRWDIRLPRGR